MVRRLFDTQHVLEVLRYRYILIRLEMVRFGVRSLLATVAACVCAVHVQRDVVAIGRSRISDAIVSMSVM